MAETIEMEARDFALPEGDRALMADAGAALGVVIRLFDREIDRETLAALADPELRRFLTGLFDSAPAQIALADLDRAFSALGAAPDEDALDLIAADYADIFLTHGHRASPSASVWLSEENTERSEPMFAVRAWYEHWGVKVPNWRMRADDHIVAMLQFVQILLESGEKMALVDAAVFLDTQMGPWVGDFLGRVAQRADSALYRATAELCAAMLAEIRDELARMTGIAEDIPVAPERPEIVPDETAFIPGAAPSW